MLAIQTRQLHGTYRKKDRIYREDLFYGQGKAISEADQKELAADIAERVSENPLAYEGNTHHFHLEKGDLVTAKKVDWRPQSNSPPSVANTHTYTHTHTNRHAHERSNPSKSPIPFYRPVELETKMKQREVRTPSDVMTGSPSNVLRPRKEGGENKLVAFFRPLHWIVNEIATNVSTCLIPIFLRLGPISTKQRFFWPSLRAQMGTDSSFITSASRHSASFQSDKIDEWT